MALTLILALVTAFSFIATLCAAAAYEEMYDDTVDRNKEETESVVRFMMRSFWTFVISFVLLIIKLIF